jgi:hypothetical protein
MFQTKAMENCETHILYPKTFFFFWKSCRLWDNVGGKIVESDRPQMKMWRLRIACWITKATNTHSECVILIAFPLQRWLHERASVLRHSALPVLFWFIDFLSVLCKAECSRVFFPPCFVQAPCLNIFAGSFYLIQRAQLSRERAECH